MNPPSTPSLPPRQVSVISGATDACRATAAQALSGITLWIGDAAPAGVAALPAGQAHRQLGRECDTLVFDAHDGFDADAFGAVTGSLRSGGRLLLLAPLLSEWRGSRFLSRLARLLQTAEGVQLVGQDDALRPFAAPPVERAVADDPDCLSDDQADAVAALLRVVHGHRRRPLVLTADRGRGKSAALGIAVARLLAEAPRRILLTAPRPSAAAEVFERAQVLLPDAERHGNALIQGAGCLTFIAPDELLRSQPDADLLLVDEAAAIPVPMLSRLLDRHARIAFATTVHGYEGSGRGFALRFRMQLDAVTPQWRECRLRTPIRYGEDDLLEALVNRMLLLDAEPAGSLPPGDSIIECLEQDALAADEALLSQVFGLLVQAHYQTSPSDLRQLLDAPDLHIWVARRGAAVSGVCLVLAEGGLDAGLAEAVARGERRPKGHLIPQSLAAHTGDAALARQRTARVMRIAVHPDVRRQGLGRGLLERVAAWAAAEDMDWWGASFAADPDTLAFWQAAGCGAVRLGAARDAASGTHSAILLSPLSPAAERRHVALRERLLDILRLGLCDAWREMEPVVAARLLADADAGSLVSDGDRVDVAAFAAGSRDLASTRPALWRLACDSLARRVDMAAEEQVLLVRRILQARPDAEVVAELGLSGRKAMVGELQSLAGALLERLS